MIREQPKTRWDQGEFNRLARYQWKPGESKGLSDPRLFWSYKREVIGGVLPLALFCGGHNYYVGQFAQRNGWEPYSIHTTFQYGGAPGKRHRLREAGVWIDPPKYYDPAGGVLTFDLDLPREMLHPPGGMRVGGHIAMINHQLAQIRAALALATALGRKLVLPEVTCGYDKARMIALTRTLTLTLTLTLALTRRGTPSPRAPPAAASSPARRASPCPSASAPWTTSSSRPRSTRATPSASSPS